MTSARADVLVIHNPAAGARDPERLRARIAAEFALLGVRVEWQETRAPGAARELAKRARSEGIPRVVVAGGDGTIAEAAAELLETRMILGILPVGSGNQLAHYLGLPRALGAAIATALGEAVRVIDVGLIDGRVFAGLAGAGVDAGIIELASREAKRRAGGVAYLISGIRAGLAPRRARLRVRVDDVEWEGVGFGAMVGNIPRLRIPLGWRSLEVFPGGSAEDGLLDCCVLGMKSRAALARALLTAFLRPGRGAGGVRYFRGRSVEVSAEPALLAQADGELIGTTPFRATVRPAVLRVAAPALRRPGRD